MNHTINDNEQRAIDIRANVQISAYNRADGVLKFANGKGYVNQGEVYAAKYAIGLDAKVGDVIFVGRQNYTVIGKNETTGTVTLDSGKVPSYREASNYTVRFKRKDTAEPIAAEPTEPVQPIQTVQSVQPTQPAEAVSAAPMNDLDAALRVLGRYAQGGNNPALEARINAIEQALDEMKAQAEQQGPVGTSQVQVQINDLPPVVHEQGAHKKFANVLNWAQLRQPIYLYGPSGTGKTTAAEQVAKQLGLKFYTCGCIMQKYELEGYMNASGEYVSTAFYHAFTEGGVFLMDELDGSNPEALIGVNSVTANRTYTFPNCKEAIKAHPDFIFIGAGNTKMNGGTDLFVARQQGDSAFGTRVASVRFEYDRDMEIRGITYNGQYDKDLIAIVDPIRNWLKMSNISKEFSFREIKKMDTARRCFGYDTKDAVDEAMFGLWDDLDVKQVAEIFKNSEFIDNVWAQGIIKLAKSL